jgi:hypothetical protein
VTTIIREDVLNDLRAIGDPHLINHALSGYLDERLDHHFAQLAGNATPAGRSGRQTLLSVLEGDDPTTWRDIATTLATEAEDDFRKAGHRIDPDRIDRAHRLFAQYGNEISAALLLAALPQAYASNFGSAVLCATGQLTHSLQRRIRGTAQFLLVVNQGVPADDKKEQLWLPSETHQLEGDATRHPPWAWCVGLRAYHELVRRFLNRSAEEGSTNPAVTAYLKPFLEQSGHTGTDRWEPINQHDLLATLLSFTITVFEVLEAFGISWSTDDQEAYLHLWDVVGAYLGVGSPSVLKALKERGTGQGANPTTGPIPASFIGLRPRSRDESRALLDQLRRREWEAPDAGYLGGGNQPGRLLVRALLDDLVAPMHPAARTWPLAVMRHLNPDVVSDRLGLGAGGVVMRSLALMPSRHQLIDRFTDHARPNVVSSRVVRTMANEVSRRAMVQFIEDGLFFPGLEEWADGFTEVRA